MSLRFVQSWFTYDVLEELLELELEVVNDATVELELESLLLEVTLATVLLELDDDVTDTKVLLELSLLDDDELMVD